MGAPPLRVSLQLEDQWVAWSAQGPLWCDMLPK